MKTAHSFTQSYSEYIQHAYVQPRDKRTSHVVIVLRFRHAACLFRCCCCCIRARMCWQERLAYSLCLPSFFPVIKWMDGFGMYEKLKTNKKAREREKWERETNVNAICCVCVAFAIREQRVCPLSKLENRNQILLLRIAFRVLVFVLRCVSMCASIDCELWKCVHENRMAGKIWSTNDGNARKCSNRILCACCLFVRFFLSFSFSIFLFGLFTPMIFIRSIVYGCCVFEMHVFMLGRVFRQSFFDIFLFVAVRSLACLLVTVSHQVFDELASSMFYAALLTFHIFSLRLF